MKEWEAIEINEAKKEMENEQKWIKKCLAQMAETDKCICGYHE